MRLRFVVLATLAAASLACIPRIDTGEDGGGTGIITVGPEGGIFVRVGAVLDIPRGAVAAETQIVVTVIDSGIPEVPGRKRISYGYRISPTKLTFKAPIKLILPWLADRVPQAVDPGTFDSRRQSDSDPYLQLPGAKTLLDFTAVEAQTDRLGLFWLTSPDQPNVARLELTPEEVVLRPGETQQFQARVIDPTGQELPVDVSFSVVAPRVADITADGGLLTAKDPGPATVTARAANQTAQAKVHVQGSTKGPLSFVHENPFPTGNDLYSGLVLPAGLGVVLVGANGTVLHRDAAGQWQRLYSSPGLVLKAVGGAAAGTAALAGQTGTTGVVVELAASGAPKATVLDNFDPRSMWFDGTVGMVVGQGNDVATRRNGVWVRDDSPSFETLLHVVGDGLGGFVTVGSRGSVYRYDPARKVWDSLYQTQLATLLTSALLTDATGTEGWAVGGGKLWHFQGAGWTALNLPNAPALDLSQPTAIGRADGRILITGRTGKQGWVLTWDPLGQGAPDGGTDPDAGTDPDGGSAADAGSGADAGTPLPPGWTAFPLRAPQVPNGLFSDGPTSTTAYVVGTLGAVYAYAGSGQFTEVSSGFYGDVVDVAAVDGTVFAAANTCANATCTAKVGRVYQRTAPGQWTHLGARDFGEIHSMTARTSTELVVATVPAVYSWDGSAWAGLPVTGGVAAPVYTLAFCGTSLHGVGYGGRYYRGGVSTLTLQPSIGGVDLFGFHCPNDAELWTSGSGALYSKSGSSLWTPRDSQAVQHPDYKAVWSPGPGEAWAFGDARYGTYWNTVELTDIDAPGGVLPDVIEGLWGSSVDNLYAVGVMNFPFTSGLAVRFDGYQWRLVDPGSQRKVTAISGASATEIWLGSEGGGVLRGVPPP